MDIQPSLQIVLEKVSYKGENLGRDWIFDIALGDKELTLRKRVSVNSEKTFSLLLAFTDYSDVPITLTIRVTEKDKTGDDSNTATKDISLTNTGKRTIAVDVIGQGSRDAGKEATLTFTLQVYESRATSSFTHSLSKFANRPS